MKTNSIQFGLGWLVGISFLFLTACKNTPETMDEEIFIPVKDSRLYVRLIGNPDKPLLLNLHGGPGAFSGFDHEFNRKHLESDYLVAYLDQRGGGKSDEILDSTTLTMEQFVEDIDGVVDALKKRFADKKINLIGSSWGGTLGLMYMTDHQDKINSFICVSGKADGIYPIKAIIAHERKLAREQLSETKDTATQKKLEKILAKLDEIDSSELDQFFEDMKLLKHSYPEELGFNAYWATKEAQAKAAELGKDSAYYARANYTKSEFDQAMKKYEFVNRVFRNTYAYNHLNILDEISAIQKPVLVIQGDKDYAIGVKQGKMIFDALTGIPADKKELVIIPNAAHNLNLEAEEIYFGAVKAFLDKQNS